MMRAVLAMILVVAGALASGAQEARNSAIEGTIQSQIEAFQIDDFATAFAFASPNIRRIFGDHVNFGLMVRQGFPMVWRPGSVKFLDLREGPGTGVQRVLIRDANGVFHTLEYEMIRTRDGWLINGVRVLRAPETGA